MRKRTVRNGMRLVLAALLLIILTSFFHGGVADLLALSAGAEQRFYSLGIFWAAAVGGYGAVLTVFGFILPARQNDAGIRLLPLFLLIVGVMTLFFYLFVASFNGPGREERLRPGETITI
ncbi:MAG TPA: hypothetical protein VF799_02440 [Geobacteraceae bacterium]